MNEITPATSDGYYFHGDYGKYYELLSVAIDTTPGMDSSAGTTGAAASLRPRTKVGRTDNMDKYKTLFYPESSFGGFTDIDGTIAFYCRVNALLKPPFVAVDFGCGRGGHQEDPVVFRRNLRSLKGKVAKVIGVDVDEIGQTNPTLDEFRFLAPGRAWPLEDQSADLVTCDCVLEHLPDPLTFFQEAKRVLVQGGYLCIRTPNAHSYVGIGSRLVPNRHHGWVLSRAQLGRKEEDVFPTLYKCNTISALRRLFSRSHFRAAVYGYAPEPSYLSFSKLAYAVGVAHQKLAPGFLRPTILAFGQSGR